MSGPAAVVVGLDCITGLQTARILAGHGVRSSRSRYR